MNSEKFLISPPPTAQEHQNRYVAEVKQLETEIQEAGFVTLCRRSNVTFCARVFMHCQYANSEERNEIGISECETRLEKLRFKRPSRNVLHIAFHFQRVLPSLNEPLCSENIIITPDTVRNIY